MCTREAKKYSDEMHVHDFYRVWKFSTLFSVGTEKQVREKRGKFQLIEEIAHKAAILIVLSL